MQQLGSAAHPHKSLMRTWKQEAVLWKEELMALLDSPTESHLPSRDCMRQQLAASILFVPYLKLTLGSFAIFPCFPQRLFLLHMLQSSFVFPTARWTHLNRETKFHHHSVLIAPSALWKNVYLLHKQVEATFNPVTLGFFTCDPMAITKNSTSSPEQVNNYSDIHKSAPPEARPAFQCGHCRKTSRQVSPE